MDLCNTLAKVTNVDVNVSSLIVTDVYNHRFHKIYEPDDSLSHILDRDDIFVYEIPKKNSNQLILPIYFREKKLGAMYENLFGRPFLLALPKENLTFKFLYDKILNSTRRYVSSAPREKLISIVNYYGNATLQQLSSNDSIIKLEDKHYL